MEDWASRGKIQGCVINTIILLWESWATETLGSAQFSSVSQLCPTLCDPMDCSTPGFSVHHQLPELAQTHQVGDVIQPSHSLSSPSPPAFSLYQYQGLFQWVKCNHFAVQQKLTQQCNSTIQGGEWIHV